MKKCKYCKSDIDKNAKICPNCRKKQNNISKWIIIAVLIIIFVPIIVSMTNEENEEKSRKKDFNQNEIATYKDVEYSITKVEKTQGNNEFVKPKEGYEYVKITIKIENKSNEKISYNALDWKLVNENGVEDNWGTYSGDDDIKLSSGNLDPNGKVEGVLVWEQKIGDNNLKLRFYDNIFDENYTLQFKIN